MPVRAEAPTGALAPAGGLPGSPQQSFHTRMNIKFAKRSLVVDLILLVGWAMREEAAAAREPGRQAGRLVRCSCAHAGASLHRLAQ